MITRKMLKSFCVAMALGGSCSAVPASAQGNCDGSPDAPGSCPKEDDTAYKQTTSPPGGRFAVAWHKESNNAWIASDFPYVENATAEAKAACNKAMGGGCENAIWGADRVVLVYRFNNGGYNAASGNTIADAEREMRYDCKKLKVTCSVINSADSLRQSEPTVNAPKGNVRRVYAYAAWADKKTRPDVKNLGRIAIASGYSSADEARSAALEACRETNKVKCKIVEAVTETFIILGIDEKKGMWATSSLTKDLDAAQLKQMCSPKSAFCDVTGAYSALDKGVQLFDPYADAQY